MNFRSGCLSLASIFLSCVAFAGSGHVSRVPYIESEVQGNGHVDRVPDITLESISKDGRASLNINGTVLSVQEIKDMDLARQLIVAKFGPSAQNWPVMVDAESMTFQFLNRNTQKYEFMGLPSAE
jgi:hypothetical protein